MNASSLRTIVAIVFCFYFAVASHAESNGQEPVRIQTDPPNASVTIEGKSIGKTPIETTVAACGLDNFLGKDVRLKVSAPYAKAIDKKVRLRSGTGIELNFVLEPIGKILPGYDGYFHPPKILLPAEVALWDDEQLPYYRNEIFARYGRYFNTPKYMEHFSAMGWYKVNKNFEESMLEDRDRKNVELILSIERPAMEPAAMRRVLLDTTEYVHGSDTFAFSDTRSLLWLKQDDAMGFYGESTSLVCSWVIIGNWVFAYPANTPDESKFAFRPDLKSNRVLEFHSMSGISHSDWQTIFAKGK